MDLFTLKELDKIKDYETRIQYVYKIDWKINHYVIRKVKSFEHNNKFLNYIINNKTSYT